MKKEIEMTRQQVRDALTPILANVYAVALAQDLTADQIIVTCLYMCGWMIKQSGIELNLDASIKSEMEPFVAGYNTTTHDSEQGA